MGRCLTGVLKFLSISPSLGLSPPREESIISELAHHLDQHRLDLLAAGMTERNAREAALAELEDTGLLQELRNLPSISEALEVECERGDREMVACRRRLLEEVSLFLVDEIMLRIAKLLIVPGAIPEKAGPDAIHIAAAALEECEFLLTWNFRHIANVRIGREVERILANHDYTKTTICTPEELI